ncbi:hypothetical protein GF348_10005 [candidate division KSB3 bacterium]|nr:hypothetical protein [candidate division KSB3 bacterium]
MKRTIYQRIVRAAERGTGLRLSAEDARVLAEDTAIYTVASADTERAVLPEDEAAHYECYVPSSVTHLADRRTCGGDGWYGCANCGRFRPEGSDI